MKIFWTFFIFILFLPLNIYANELRIISLAPSLTEIIYSLGLGKNLVGNTLQCNYPKEASSVYKIGDYTNPNIEKILSVKPNYVLATMGNPKSLLNKLKLYHIRVVEIEDPKTVLEMPSIIEKIAKEFKIENKGNEIAQKITIEIERLKRKKGNNIKFLLALQFNPIYSVSNNTWIGNLFTLGGFSNIVGFSRASYPILTKEYLIKNKPEVIFTTSSNTNMSYEENKEVVISQMKPLYGYESAKNIRVVFLPKDILVRPGPRITEGMRFIENLSF